MACKYLKPSLSECLYKQNGTLRTLSPRPQSLSLFALSFCLLTPSRLCAKRYVPVCIHKPSCPEGVAPGDFSTRCDACFFPLVYLCKAKRVLDVPIINPSSPVPQIMYSRSLGILCTYVRISRIAFLTSRRFSK